MVGLNDVDNTSNFLEPIFNATHAALKLNASFNNPTFPGTISGINKDMVGLNSVDNTTDLLKPISIDTQAGLDLKAPLNNPTFTVTVKLYN